MVDGVALGEQLFLAHVAAEDALGLMPGVSHGAGRWRAALGGLGDVAAAQRMTAILVGVQPQDLDHFFYHPVDGHVGHGVEANGAPALVKCPEARAAVDLGHLQPGLQGRDRAGAGVGAGDAHKVIGALLGLGVSQRDDQAVGGELQILILYPGQLRSPQGAGVANQDQGFVAVGNFAVVQGCHPLLDHGRGDRLLFGGAHALGVLRFGGAHERFLHQGMIRGARVIVQLVRLRDAGQPAADGGQLEPLVTHGRDIGAQGIYVCRQCLSLDVRQAGPGDEIVPIGFESVLGGGRSSAAGVVVGIVQQLLEGFGLGQFAALAGDQVFVVGHFLLFFYRVLCPGKLLKSDPSGAILRRFQDPLYIK